MNNIILQWLERFYNEEEIDLFDLIATNCSYLSKYDAEKMIRELIYFFVKKRDRATSELFIEQLKEYREEWFED